MQLCKVEGTRPTVGVSLCLVVYTSSSAPLPLFERGMRCSPSSMSFEQDYVHSSPPRELVARTDQVELVPSFRVEPGSWDRDGELTASDFTASDFLPSRVNRSASDGCIRLDRALAIRALPSAGGWKDSGGDVDAEDEERQRDADAGK